MFGCELELTDLGFGCELLVEIRKDGVLTGLGS